jgi:hypothetical protein
VIRINFGDSVERYSKSIEINANDVDPNSTNSNDDNDPTPPELLLAAIIANKSGSDSGGQPV